MARGRKIIRFSRDYRRPPKWGMGLPPRRPKRRHGPLSGIGIKVILAVIAVLVLVGTAGDAANGWLKADSECRVLKIMDGDTLKIHCGGRKMPSARLRGFDTPELYSPGCVSEFWRAVAATYALRWYLLTARKISVIPEGRDLYDRALVRLRVDGTDIARRMIENGWARPYAGGRREGWCT